MVRSLSATADAYVDIGSPGTTFGSASTLEVDTAITQHIYLRFDGGGMAGALRDAKIRLFATNPGIDGPTVFATSGAWDEQTLTWNNRPPPTGPVLADVGPVDEGEVVVDLGQGLAGGGPFSFVLLPAVDDGVTFQSRESGNGPVLLLELCEPQSDGASR